MHKNSQEFLISVYEDFHLNYPKFYKMDHVSKLGWLASEILLVNESVVKQVDPYDIGIVLSNTNSSLDTDIKYLQQLPEFASPALFVYTLPNIVAGEICIRNHFKGENAFFITDDFDPAFTEQYVSGLLDNDLMQLCICGWVEFLKEEYKAVLFLVGKNPGAESLAFTTENLQHLFHQHEI
ncbi:MAG: hypothetical protein ABJA78_02450 [Ferruginibacter sp.]